MSPAHPNRPHRRQPHPAAPLTPYGNRPMVTPIVHAVNYEYLNFEVLRQITAGEVDGYTYHRDDNPTVRAVERQWMCRMSSPGTYCRCSANSTEKPLRGLRWRPEMKPSTSPRAMNSKREIVAVVLPGSHLM